MQDPASSPHTFSRTTHINILPSFQKVHIGITIKYGKWQKNEETDQIWEHSNNVISISKVSTLLQKICIISYKWIFRYPISNSSQSFKARAWIRFLFFCFFTNSQIFTHWPQLSKFSQGKFIWKINFQKGLYVWFWWRGRSFSPPSVAQWYQYAVGNRGK